MGMLAASNATGQLVFLPLIAELDHALRLAHGAGLRLLHAGARRASSRCCSCATGRAISICRSMAKPQSTPPPAAGVGLVSLLMSPLDRAARTCARVPIFWVLFGTFFVCGCSTNGLIQTHFITLCHDYGLAAATAASVLAMMGVFDFFGTIGSGWLSDRFDNRWLLFWYYGLRGLSLLYLPFTDFTLLRPVAVRRVLRPRLDRHRAADGEAHRRPLRAASAPAWCSAGSSPAIRSAPPARPSAPAWCGRNIRPTCRRSSSPARSASSRRCWS